MDKNKKLLFIIYIILILSLGFFAFQYFRYQTLYHIAIRQGAENTVTALEMVTVCMTLSNITDRELKEAYVDMFITPKLLEEIQGESE